MVSVGVERGPSSRSCVGSASIPGPLNGAGDNEWFTLLCKLPRWDLDEPEPIVRSFALLERAMQGLLGPTQGSARRSSGVVDRSTSVMRRDRLTDDMSEDWLLNMR